MKKGIILLLAVCLFCCGCSPRLIAELSDHSGFFYRFSAGSRDGLYLVKGTACQSTEAVVDFDFQIKAAEHYF